MGGSRRARRRRLQAKSWLVAGAFGLLAASATRAQSLDPAFGTGGKVFTTFTASPTADKANAAVLLSDGRIVVAGQGGQGFELARYTTAGTLDAAFGTGGKVGTDFGPSVGSGGTDTRPSRAFAMQVQTDGKIIAAGRRGNEWALARYTGSGSLDPAFGLSGKATARFTTLGGWVTQIGVQSTGAIVVLGNDVALSGTRGYGWRLTANGTYDTSFSDFYPFAASTGQTGTSAYLATLNDGLIDAADRILVIGSFQDYASGSGPDSYASMRLVRRLANGAPDASFGINGSVRLDVPPTMGSTAGTVGQSVCLLPNGQILVVGSTNNATTPCFLARYNDNGTLDTSFGTNGIQEFSGLVPGLAGGEYPPVLGVKVQADGKILVRGASPSTTDFALARFNANGTPDASFGTGGVYLIDEGAQDMLNAVLLQSDGKYVGVGYTVAAGSSDARFALMRVMPAAVGFTWTGAVSSLWTDAGNWSGGQVPGLNDNATIPGGLTRYPVFGTTQSIGGVSLQGGASLTQTGGTLTINGAFANAGTFTQTGGTLALGGSSAQSFGGGGVTMLRELTIGAAGATLAGPVQIERVLTLNGNLSTNNNLTLLSSASNTALVVNNGGVATGGATVQRYLDGSFNVGNGYRHLSTPVTGSMFGHLRNAVVNPVYNSSPNPYGVTPFPTVFGYDQQRLTNSSATTSAFDYGWMSPTFLTDGLQSGMGYTFNLAPYTINFTGQLFNGALTLTLPRGATANSGWHLIGNPYPAPVNWDLVATSGLDQAMYVYRSTGLYAGGYQSYVNGIGAPGSNIISEGQAFFVRTSSSATPGSVNFSNAARLTSPQNNLVYRPQETRPVLALALRATASAATAQDVFYLYQEAGATAGFDTRFDAHKLQPNGGAPLSLYQQAGAEAFSIQGVAEGTQPLALPLGLHVATAGQYELTPVQLENFPASATLYLEDRQTGTWHDLRTGRYAVQLADGANTTRFVLHLNEARPLAAASATRLKLNVYPNPIQDGRLTVEATGLPTEKATLQIRNNLGQVVYQRMLTMTNGTTFRQEVQLPGIGAGVYMVQVFTSQGALTNRLVVK